MAADRDKGGAAVPNPLKQQIQGLAGVAGRLALSAARRKVEQTTKRLTGVAEGEGIRTLARLAGAEGGTGRVKGLASVAWGGLKKKLGGGGKRKLTFTNIVETLDIGAPVRLVYDFWTQFAEWPTCTKKIEKVVQDSDEKLTWQAKIFLSRRAWESTIIEQVPDERIIWRSQGAKGYLDGSVTFHPLAPELTRVLMVLEYHPKGLVEHVGNLWRAPGRRARLEFKHLRRHIMTQVLPRPDEVEGWRGVIHDGEVVTDHETAVREEEEAAEREREDGEDRYEEEEQGEPAPGRHEVAEGEAGAARGEPREPGEADGEAGEADGEAEPGEGPGVRRRLGGAGRHAEHVPRPRPREAPAREAPSARRQRPAESDPVPVRRRGPVSGEREDAPVRRHPEGGERPVRRRARTGSENPRAHAPRTDPGSGAE